MFTDRHFKIVLGRHIWRANDYKECWLPRARNGSSRVKWLVFVLNTNSTQQNLKKRNSTTWEYGSISFVSMVTHEGFIYISLKMEPLCTVHNKQYHMKACSIAFILMVTHFDPQTLELEPPCTASMNSNTWKYCSIALICRVTHCCFFPRLCSKTRCKAY